MSNNEQVIEVSSLAELSRQYLYGNVGVEEYLALEKRLTSHSGESSTAAIAIEEKYTSDDQKNSNQDSSQRKK